MQGCGSAAPSIHGPEPVTDDDMLAALGQLHQYRRLIVFLTWGRLKSGERDKAFGKLWSLLDPLAQLGIYYFVFNVIFQSKVENFSLFLFTAIIAWRFFSKSVTASALCIIANRNLVSEAYFPKSVLPISTVLMNAHDYLYGFIVLLLMALLSGVPITLMIVFWPLVFLCQFAFTLWISILAADLGVFFRDLQNILEIAFRLLFYFSGTMYSISRVPEHLQIILRLNPIYIFFEGYRNILLYNEFPPFLPLAVILLVSLLLTWLALRLMGRREGEFLKHL